MRLDKYLSDMRIGTRKEVKEIIRKGRVKINDSIVKKSDIHLSESDIVIVDDRVIEYLEYEYYLLNKPAGYITATDDNFQKTVMELIDSKRKDLFPLGRLDKDTEGVLLISNDGVLGHHLLSPKYHVDKKYYVETDKPITPEAEEIFSKPMEFDDFVASPARFERIDDYHAYLTISEGKFHQVKRMFERIGTRVIYLNRVEFAFLNTDGLSKGEYRHLTKEEIKELYKLANLNMK